MSKVWLLLLLASVASVAAGEDAACGDDGAALLQVNSGRGQMSTSEKSATSETSATSEQIWPEGRYQLQGKSVYLLMIDRFGREGGKKSGDESACSESQDWCYGTIKGITEHVAYIQGLGFDCVWITPPVKNYDKDDSINSSCGSGASGYAGYWAEDWYAIDANFGTEADLKELSATLHKEGMCLVLDIVANHVRPIHSAADVAMVKPFDDISYYHQKNAVGIAPPKDFDEYAAKYCNWPNAIQGQGPGTLCYLTMSDDGTPDYTNGGNYCNNYQGNEPWNKSSYLGEQAAGPPDFTYCGPGNYDCIGYDEENTHLGWFYDLGDLNQSVPFVRQELLKWVRYMIDTYDVDGIRLDTAPFMDWDFLHELQAAAWPVQIYGEVTTTNLTFHASFQRYPPVAGGLPVLHGMSNFPATYMATPGYCGPNTGSPSTAVAYFNLSQLAIVMEKQVTSGEYATVHSLMNFMSQQDSAPVANYCRDPSQIRNSLVWTMFSYGIPVVAWGTEQGNEVYRNSLWQTGYDTSPWEYKLISQLNAIRRQTQVALQSTEIIFHRAEKLVFTRGGQFGVWVFTNNLEAGASPVKYPVSLPETAGRVWKNALTGAVVQPTAHELVVESTEPLVLVQVDSATPPLEGKSPSEVNTKALPSGRGSAD